VGAYYAIPVRGAERADYDDDQREQLRRIGYVIEDDGP